VLGGTTGNKVTYEKVRHGLVEIRKKFHSVSWSNVGWLASALAMDNYELKKLQSTKINYIT
jgi:hypothetical protein